MGRVLCFHFPLSGLRFGPKVQFSFRWVSCQVVDCCRLNIGLEGKGISWVIQWVGEHAVVDKIVVICLDDIVNKIAAVTGIRNNRHVSWMHIEENVWLIRLLLVQFCCWYYSLVEDECIRVKRMLHWHAKYTSLFW